MMITRLNPRQQMEEMMVYEMTSIADVVSLQYITSDQEKDWLSGLLSVRKLSMFVPQVPEKQSERRHLKMKI